MANGLPRHSCHCRWRRLLPQKINSTGILLSHACPAGPSASGRENVLFQPRIVHDDDVALLEIAFGRRAQCERTEPVQQFERHRICRKPSDHAARRELRMQRRRIRGDLQMRVVCSKPALER